MSFLDKLRGNGGAERGGYGAPQAPKAPGLHAVDAHVDPLLNAAGGYAGMKDADGKLLVGELLMAKIQQQFSDSEKAAIVIGHVEKIRVDQEQAKARQ